MEYKSDKKDRIKQDIRRLSQNRTGVRLIAVMLILLLVFIVLLITLSSRISKQKKQIADSKTEISALNKSADRLNEKIAELTAENKKLSEAQKVEEKEASWLDLSGFSYLDVTPKKLNSGYEAYFVSSKNGVNLRSGPGTDYTAITSVKYKAKVNVAAVEGDWAFLSTGSKFGWIKAEFLSRTRS